MAFQRLGQRVTADKEAGVTGGCLPPLPAEEGPTEGRLLPETFATDSADRWLAERAAGYGIPGVVVDGNDALAVYVAMENAVARARAGQGPSLIEARTVRFMGHFEGDPQGYRSRGEVEAGRQRDPIARLRAHLEDTRLLDESHAARVAAAVELEIEDAVDFAEASPLPAPEDALQDLFVQYPWRD